MPASAQRSPVKFFLLTFTLAIPFLILGSITGFILLPGLPIAALSFICPAFAAAILVYRENGVAGISALLKRSFDAKRIGSKLWYLPALLLVPCVVILSYVIMRLDGAQIPSPEITLPTALELCAVFSSARSAKSSAGRRMPSIRCSRSGVRSRRVSH
jgi:uncharacterized protein